MRTADWTDSVSVLDRLTAVLEAFEVVESGVGVSELARRANLPKSTVSRIAAELAEQGCLEQVGGKLALGLRLFELGNAVEEPRRLREAALLTMSQLRDATGHSVTLFIADGDSVVAVVAVAGRPGTPAPTAVGSRHDARGSTVGKALLAFRARVDEHPGSSVSGGAVVIEHEDGSGLVTLACPVLGGPAGPVAALSVVSTRNEGQIERLTHDVGCAARAITRRLATACPR